MNTQKTVKHVPHANVVLLLPEGFGFGDGSISAKEQLAHPERSGLTKQAFDTGKDIILNDERVWVVVEVNDDGCGDGRPTSVVYRMVPAVPGQPGSQLQEQVFNTSKNRAKVFGGGLVVASSMLRTAAWGKLTPRDTVLSDRQQTAEILKGVNIAFGAHTDNHAHGDSSGCGAIDKYPVTVEKTLKYRDKIQGVLHAYVGDDWDEAWQADSGYVFASYQDQLDEAAHYFMDTEGRKTISLVEHAGGVIKQLADDHLEDYVVLNDVDDTTFDQRTFDSIMHERGVEGTAQVFAVDVWRGRMYAAAIASYAASNLGMKYDTVYRRSLIDFLARSTSGPSVTLTDGTQPVFFRASA